MKMRLCFAALIAAGIASGTARAFDVFWLPAGTADWNNVNNWADTVGGAPRGFVPSSALEDVANINNGGTATLTAAAGDTPGGVVLGAAAADSGTLSISSAGSLTSVVSASTNEIGRAHV